MSEETLKQIAFGFLLAYIFGSAVVVLIFMGLIRVSPGPESILSMLVFLLFAPGALSILLLLLVLMLVFTLPLLLLSLGPIGWIIGLALGGWGVWWWNHGGGEAAFHDAVEEATGLIRSAVEFSAWLSFLFGSWFGSDSLRGNTEASSTGARAPTGEEEEMPDRTELVSVNAEIGRLKQRYPELPSPPTAFYSNEYEGWFREAKKRFELQSYGRTQEERVKTLKQINELQSQCLAILKNEGDLTRFRQEERQRQMRLSIEDTELEIKAEEARQKLEKLRAGKSTDPEEDAFQTELSRWKRQRSISVYELVTHPFLRRMEIRLAAKKLKEEIRKSDLSPGEMEELEHEADRFLEEILKKGGGSSSRRSSIYSDDEPR